MEFELIKDPVEIHYLYCAFWILTYSDSIRSTAMFWFRGLVVVAYTVFSWSDIPGQLTIFEWLAEMFTSFSWVGMACAIFYPDPRFRRLPR